MTSSISTQTALLLSTIHTLLYVGTLYVREASRPSITNSRDVPSVMKARFVAVGVACVLSVFGNRWVIHQARKAGYRTELDGWDDVLGGWGEWEIDFWKTLRALGLTAVLFLGPLVDRLWILEGWRYFWSDTHYAVKSLEGWRNYIVVFQLMMF
jgi:prenyl protein peptidase